ncbi:hypothetical protein F0562_032867 [Nyssa sinensis]|uniref:Band 7 domain-containing protein n=1 Tax=Nyssa sinensis TaxID=561372 RepID=A0A5J5AT39_9ASTE|nr:hypothetical protein F0562_032867 [Nyssa sinensis]
MPWCLGMQIAGVLSLRVQQLDVRCETKDKVASVQYRALAEKASDAFYKLSNTKEQIRAYVFDVIRASVPRLELDAAFEQKNDIAKAVENELEKAMSHYGYEIVQTLIVDIEPDEHVKTAMNEINAAARTRVAANEKAEAEKILQLKRAEGRCRVQVPSWGWHSSAASGHCGWAEGQRACLLLKCAWDNIQRCHGHGFGDPVLRHYEGDWCLLKVFLCFHPTRTRSSERRCFTN